VIWKFENMSMLYFKLSLDNKLLKA